MICEEVMVDLRIPDPNSFEERMMQVASEFGLTPSARSRIMAASGIKKDDVGRFILMFLLVML